MNIVNLSNSRRNINPKNVYLGVPPAAGGAGSGYPFQVLASLWALHFYP